MDSKDWSDCPGDDPAVKALADMVSFGTGVMRTGTDGSVERIDPAAVFEDDPLAGVRAALDFALGCAYQDSLDDETREAVLDEVRKLLSIHNPDARGKL